VESNARGEKVLVITHVPLHVKATKSDAVLWDFKETVEVLHMKEPTEDANGADSNSNSKDSNGIKNGSQSSVAIACDEKESSDRKGTTITTSAPLTTPVVAVFAGHQHSGGYHLDECGIHHITVESPLECAKGQYAFAGVLVYGDRLHVLGNGRVPSRTCHYAGAADAEKTCHGNGPQEQGRGKGKVQEKEQEEKGVNTEKEQISTGTVGNNSSL
jgi:hypothetical protein